MAIPAIIAIGAGAVCTMGIVIISNQFRRKHPVILAMAVHHRDKIHLKMQVSVKKY
jgi:hypothetical protein